MADHYYLSPHLDDAALSCGGRIHQLTANREQVTVVTLCAGDAPSGAFSPFAQSLHDRWQTPGNAVDLRREEDRQAGKALGAHIIHLEIPDAVYRRDEEGHWLYASEQAIFRPLHPAEFDLIAEVARTLRGLIPPEAEVVVPLAAGKHVDHRLARAAAERLPHRLIYSEDYPYAEEFGAVEDSLAGADWEPVAVEIGEADLRAKIEAVACYRSQISTFWPDEETMRRAVRTFALQAGDRLLAERYWRKL